MLLIAFLTVLLKSIRTLSSLGRNSNYAILVHSFDGYSSFWGASSRSLKLFAPDFDHIYFATDIYPEHNPYLTDIPHLKMILTGTGSFVKRLITALQNIDNSVDYVLYLQEDMWISRKLNKSAIDTLYNIARSSHLSTLKLCKTSHTLATLDSLSPFCNIGFNSNVYLYGNNDYVMSHHPSLHSIDYLKATLLVSYIFRRDDPHAHEYFTSNITRNFSKPTISLSIGPSIGVVDPPIFLFAHASSSGQLTPEGISWLEQHSNVT